MASITIKAKFNMSYGELTQLADSAVSLIDRDMSDLQRFGVTVADRTFIKTQADLLRNFPTDEELLGTQSIKTRVKDEAREATQKAVSEIMVRVKIFFGISSQEYGRYGTKELYDASDADAVRIAHRVHRVATEDLTELATRGLTQTELDALQTQIQKFDNALDAKEVAVRNRDRTQQQRISLSNPLYDKIVEVFDCGKAVFDGDPARYNDYIIYDTPAAPVVATAKAAAAVPAPVVVVPPVVDATPPDAAAQ